MMYFLMIELVSIAIGLLAIIAFIFTLFYKRNELNTELPVIVVLTLYLFSLIPLGFFIGLYLAERKRRNVEGIKKFKYSKSVRNNGYIILCISVVATIVKISNL